MDLVSGSNNIPVSEVRTSPTVTHVLLFLLDWGPSSRDGTEFPRSPFSGPDRGVGDQVRISYF